MCEREGVIQFSYEMQSAPDLAAAPTERRLLAWRTVLRKLELLGQVPERYGGFGYGNLSARDPHNPHQFIITASQTSGIDHADAKELCRICRVDFERFWVAAQGTKPPSSESLTHAMIYAADSTIAWIFHAHSPEIWERAERLGLPAIAADVSYGSPEMAVAVAKLLAILRTRPLAFVTRGHTDGVFACGATANTTGCALVGTLARSYSEPDSEPQI